MNILYVPVIKKNEKIRVCIDFKDLNRVTPKDEYSMPIVDDLIDKMAGHALNSSFNQIFIADEDVHKTDF